MHTEVEPRSNSWLTPRWIPQEDPSETEHVIFRGSITPADGKVFFLGPFHMLPDMDIAVSISAQSLIVSMSLWTAHDIDHLRHDGFDKSKSPMTHQAVLFYSAGVPISVAYRVELAEPSTGRAIVTERFTPTIGIHSPYYEPPPSSPAAR